MSSKKEPTIKRFAGLTADSRAVQPGFLFAALPGTKNDGREFIADAISRGAMAVLAPIGTPVPDSVELITHANPRAAFARMAAEFYGAQPEVIFAVTGTNGKTSTVNLLKQIWEGLGHSAAAMGTLGVFGTHFAQEGSLTTPDPVRLHETLANLKKNSIDHLAIEASSHGIDQERLAGVKIAAGIFTNLTRDHLDYHGTLENYFAAKTRLFTELLPAGAAAAINVDDEYGRRLIATIGSRLRICSFGAHESADLKLLNYTPHADGFDVQLSYQNKNHAMHLPLLGKFQIWNTMGALSALLLSGTPMEKLLPLVAQLKPVRGRLELVGRAAAGAPVFVDYAHTPDALENVLSAVREHAHGRLTVIFGCGGNRDKGKRPQMGAIAVRMAEHVIVTDDNPRHEDAAMIRAEVMAGATGACEIGDRRAAIETAILELGAGDILVIAGKGHEQGQIIGDQIIPFDDAAVAQEFLSQRGAA